jgi:hypothetical protein
MDLQVVQPIEQTRSLEDIADDIRAAQYEGRRAMLDGAVRIGQLLLEARPQFTGDEKGYLAWARTEFGYRRAHVFNLLKLANEVQRVGRGALNGSLRQVLAALIPDEEDEEPAPPPEPGTVELDEDVSLLRYCQNLDTATIVALILAVFFGDAETALDVTYGSGNFWNGSAHVRVAAAHDANPNRAPGGAADFRELHYGDNSFDVVVFDPPHIADAGEESVMGHRFGTYSNAELPTVIADGTREAWRVAKLGIVVKVTDHSHSGRYVLESDWVRSAIDVAPYDVVHQVRTGALVDPKWNEQMSAYNNGSTFLIFRKDGPLHRRRTRA